MPKNFGLQQYLDFNAPQLKASLVSSPSLQIAVEGSDKLSGVNLLKIEAKEGEETRTVFEHQFKPEELSFKLDLPISKLDLREGLIDLTFELSDRAYFNKQTSQQLSLEIDRTPPTLEILSQQHRMYGGGAEIVLYKTSDKELVKSGIELDNNFFQGQPLKKVFPSYNVPDDVYIVVFAAALELRASDFKPILLAEDSYSNRSQIPLIFTFTERQIPTGSPKLSDKFLNTKIPPLVNEASRKYPKLFKPFPNEELTEDDWIKYFKLVNEDFRKELRDDLKEMLINRSTVQFIDKPFIRPMGGSLMSGFGEYRTYFYNNKEASRSVHEGFDLASVKYDKVVAAAPGKVLLAGQYGIYGGSVLIDHGLGLSSLSGHLSSIAVKEGDNVEAGTVIGKSGETGLAGGDHLHFEIRVGFVPVTPIEWWDNLWFRDDVFQKIEGVVKSFNSDNVEEQAQVE